MPSTRCASVEIHPWKWLRRALSEIARDELCYSEPFVVGSCLHTTHSSQGAKIIFWDFRKSTTEPFHTMWNSFYMKFFKSGSQCNFSIIHLQDPTQCHHQKKHPSYKIAPCDEHSTSIKNTNLIKPNFDVPNLPSWRQDFHQRVAQLCYSEPVVGSCLHTTRSSQGAKLTA